MIADGVPSPLNPTIFMPASIATFEMQLDAKYVRKVSVLMGRSHHKCRRRLPTRKRVITNGRHFHCELKNATVMDGMRS